MVFKNIERNSSPASPTNNMFLQDEQLYDKDFKSIMKIDYPSHNVNEKSVKLKPLNLAEVMHKDTKYFNSNQSETRLIYHAKAITQNTSEKNKNLSATNFKTERDDRMKSYVTSTEFYFKNPTVNAPLDPIKKHSTSYVPQGDLALSKNSSSEYANQYQECNILKPIKCKENREGIPIYGDDRLSNFTTTGNKFFVEKELPHTKSIPASKENHISFGDKEKVNHKKTLHKESYGGHDDTDLTSYDKKAVIKTNFIMGDTIPSSHFESSMQSSFKECDLNAKAKICPEKDPCGFSCFYPHTEDQPKPFTSNEYFFSETIKDYIFLTLIAISHSTTYQWSPHPVSDVKTPKVKIIKGANIFTKSNVHFGKPDCNENLTSTTLSTYFDQNPPPRDTTRPDFNTRSHIPVDSSAETKDWNTTHRRIFNNPNQSKMILNSNALENLKKTSIEAPFEDMRVFSTQYDETFTPKQLEYHTIDPHRFLKSRVPLGTIKI